MSSSPRPVVCMGPLRSPAGQQSSPRPVNEMIREWDGACRGRCGTKACDDGFAWPIQYETVVGAQCPTVDTSMQRYSQLFNIISGIFGCKRTFTKLRRRFGHRSLKQEVHLLRMVSILPYISPNVLSWLIPGPITGYISRVEYMEHSKTCLYASSTKASGRAISSWSFTAIP
jgi:hypothetical protein